MVRTVTLNDTRSLNESFYFTEEIDADLPSIKLPAASIIRPNKKSPT